MVWGSIARDVENGSIDTVRRMDAGLEEGYPMYVLPMEHFLAMDQWKPHQELLHEGKLKRFEETMRGQILFCSHQWVSYNHPDPGGDQLEALQHVIKRLASGQMQPRGNGVVEHAFGLKIGRSAKAWVEFFSNGAYLWFDFASMPQPLAAKAKAGRSMVLEECETDEYVAPHTDHRQSVTDDTSDELIEQLKRAVDSIPSYIERCAEMFILVPSVKHADRAGETCDFNTWRSRGWCRMEFVSSRLSCCGDIPCMVIDSREKTPEYFNLCDTMRLFAGNGTFTVDADKEKVAGVLEKMVEAKAVAEWERGNPGMFRAYLTLSGTFLTGLPRTIEMPEGLASEADAIKSLMKWREEEVEATWVKTTGCTPLHVACGLGRTSAVIEMIHDAAYKPYINKKMGVVNQLDAEYKTKAAKGMGVATIVEACKGLTPLAAALLCGDAEMITALMKAGASPSHSDFGLACMMGTAANMRTFLQNAPAFDVNARKMMMGGAALHAVCMFGDAAGQAAKIELLLEHGARKSLHARNMLGFTPLSCLAGNADGAAECVKLLVDAGAEPDRRDRPGAAGRMMRGLLAVMAKTRKFENMQMMVDMMGYGRTPFHHAAHQVNVGMLRALHAAGASVDQTDKKARSALDLIEKSVPDSHAPELLADVLSRKGQKELKPVGAAAIAVNRLRRRPSGGAYKVHPVALPAE